MLLPALEAQEFAGFGLTGKLAEKRQGYFRQGVNTGSAFPRWSELRDDKGLKNHAEVPTFLLDTEAWYQ